MIAAAAAATSPRARRWAIGALLVGSVFYFTVVFPRLLEFGRLFGPHAGTVMTQEQVLDAHNASLSLPDSRPRPVPRIIHQVYLDGTTQMTPANRTIPQELEAARRTCESLHPTWEYKVRSFLSTPHPPFLLSVHTRRSVGRRIVVFARAARRAEGTAMAMSPGPIY